VFDLGVADAAGPLQPGQLFFTGQLLDGERPQARLAASALCQLIAEVASALEALHRRGLVHHDVKPDNLLVDDAGGVHLGDLGLAAARGAGGDLRGTLAYLAPEALEGRGAIPARSVCAWGHRLGAVARPASPSGGDGRRALARPSGRPRRAPG